jgi:hypothetical protein
VKFFSLEPHTYAPLLLLHICPYRLLIYLRGFLCPLASGLNLRNTYYEDQHLTTIRDTIGTKLEGEKQGQGGELFDYDVWETNGVGGSRGMCVWLRLKQLKSEI